jgi:hypothetical protein
MNQSDLAIFSQAVTLAQTGQKAEAYRQLKGLFQSYPTEPNILLWLVFTTPDLQEAEVTLTLISPSEPNLVSAQNWLAEEKRKRLEQTSLTSMLLPTQQPVPYQPASAYQIPSQPPIQQRGRLNDNEKRNLVGLAAVVIFVLFVYFSNYNAYTFYSNSTALHAGVHNGDKISFTGALNCNFQDDTYIYCNWNEYRGSSMVGVRYDHSKFSPTSGVATYYVKVLEAKDKYGMVQTELVDIK